MKTLHKTKTLQTEDKSIRTIKNEREILQTVKTLQAHIKKGAKMKKIELRKGEAEFTRFDITDYIKTDEDIEIYLNTILEDKESTDKDMQRALKTIARIKGMSKIAKDTNIGREKLYRTLDENTDAKFSTIYKLLKNFGLTLTVKIAN